MASWCAFCFALAVATIYRCPAVDGTPLFTDRPCPLGAAVQLDPADVLEWPALGDADWARLRRLDGATVRRQEVLHAERLRSARAAAAAAAARARRCSAARVGLARIQAIKRRGYAAGSAADLAARQRKYALQFDRHCR